MNRQVIREIKYKPTLDRVGYIRRVERVEFGDEEIDIVSYYTEDGKYLGDKDTAMYLIKKKQIDTFEYSTPDSTIVTVGYNSNTQTWYGWSHRAIFGFTIGSTCKMGDSHFIPSNKEEFIEDAKRFYREEDQPELGAEEGTNDAGKKGVWVGDKQKRKGTIAMFCTYPERWGRGEWTAKTLDDAKQMAMDFAESVS